MTKVRDVMKTHVVTVKPDTDMKTIAKILTNNRIGCVVIVDKDKPLGTITTNDIVTLVATNRNPKDIKALAYWKERARPFITVSPNENILKVAKKMVKTGLKRFPVIDKNGKLVGIISTKEILIVSPEMIQILSEKLKAKVDAVARPDQTISGLCENCDQYSDELVNVDGRWLCQECREEVS